MKNELYLRFLVVLKHSVGVEGGSIVHLLYIWTRLLTLRWGEIKSPESCDINTSLNILSSARFISGEKRRPDSNLHRPTHTLLIKVEYLLLRTIKFKKS